jgi:hypothetical protein
VEVFREVGAASEVGEAVDRGEMDLLPADRADFRGSYSALIGAFRSYRDCGKQYLPLYLQNLTLFKPHPLFLAFLSQSPKISVIRRIRLICDQKSL